MTSYHMISVRDYGGPGSLDARTTGLSLGVTPTSRYIASSMPPVSTSFLFQAEDGIRVYKVTGVQTCALPILLRANPGAVRTAYHRVVRELLRSVWAEPRPPDPPARIWRDWALVGVAVPLALLEGLLRPDPSSRAFSVIIALALVPTLLWPPTRPLLMVTIAFAATGVAPLLPGPESGLVYPLVFPYG